MNTLPARPPAGYELIGDGEHSRVYRPPHGGRFCVQYFLPQAPELTPDKVETEYAYLMRTYTPTCPNLIPDQVLIRPAADAPLCQMVLVKEWVPVRTEWNLGRTSAEQLPASTRHDLAEFIATTRHLLERVPHQDVLLPDIIDDRFLNLAVDTAGRVRLVDTNRLINTRALQALGPGQSLDIQRRWIHGRFLRRLMYLEAAFTGRTRTDLRADALYRRYLSEASITTLLDASTAAGEQV
ncbi:hypothetical protein [Nocardiopsis synnemataformans]|uniref:hypothetical protein n=1 Tax=Nocardiopsis synnemataformans TaxID=61305 RepID=UPI003EB9FF65